MGLIVLYPHFKEVNMWEKNGFRCSGQAIKDSRLVMGYFCKVEGRNYILPDNAEILDASPNGLGVGNPVEIDIDTRKRLA